MREKRASLKPYQRLHLWIPMPNSPHSALLCKERRPAGASKAAYRRRRTFDKVSQTAPNSERSREKINTWHSLSTPFWPPPEHRPNFRWPSAGSSDSQRCTEIFVLWWTTGHRFSRPTPQLGSQKHTKRSVLPQNE